MMHEGSWPYTPRSDAISVGTNAPTHSDMTETSGNARGVCAGEEAPAAGGQAERRTSGGANAPFAPSGQSSLSQASVLVRLKFPTLLTACCALGDCASSAWPCPETRQQSACGQRE
eukprot:6190127-Pleurochrysis_carterae.AAC.2